MRVLWVLLAWLALAGAAWAEAAPRVELDSGAAAGVLEGDAVVFRGLPYAAPPVGPLRWKPPQPVKPWPGVREASRFGPICPQPAGARRLSPADANEDCLYLNVWAPAARPAKPAPVMVFLHGGGFETGAGSDPLYDGQAFARDGVVLVTLNYRLGALGFFAHPALTAEAGKGEPLADYGLMDQVAALRWVKRNIAAFGGDPANVTVFGESAGGVSVVTLLTVPSARGLFQKAIVESAGFWQWAQPLAQAESEGVAVARAAGLEHASAEQLRALPLAQLVKPDEETGPAVDGRFLPQSPLAAFRAGEGARVPLIVGTNDNEGSLISGADPADTLKDLPADRLAALYGDAPDEATRARRVFTDWGFAAPARWLARHGIGAPTWLYRFSYVSSLRPAPGAGHGSELVYVFESGRMLAAVRDFPDMPDIRMAKLAHGCWVAFARTGAPDCGLRWPPYDPKTGAVMALSSTPGEVPDPRAAQLDYQASRLGLDR